VPLTYRRAGARAAHLPEGLRPCRSLTGGLAPMPLTGGMRWVFRSKIVCRQSKILHRLKKHRSETGYNIQHRSETGYYRLATTNRNRVLAHCG
jgi:hypothetical protein